MARKVFDADYDFIGFTYNGYHSIDDLKIYRVSDGDRYDLGVTPTSKDATAEVPDGDGMYFFESWHTKKAFQIKFAFDDLSDEDLRILANVFNGMEEHELIFDEWPYKAYDAVVSQPIQINYISFDKSDGSRVYKGDGTISFTCHYPYAHTPNKTNEISGTYNTTLYFELDRPLPAGVHTILSGGTIHPTSIEISTKDKMDYWMSDLTNNISCDLMVSEATQIQQIATHFEGPLDTKFKGILKLFLNLGKENNYETLIDEHYLGINPSTYSCSATKHQWLPASGLTKTVGCLGENYGDLPAPFVLRYTNEIKTTTSFTVGDTSITVYGTNTKKYTDFEWRSETGLVLAKTNGGIKRPIYFTGSSRATIPKGDLNYSQIFVKPQGEDAITISQSPSCPIKLKYHYWYY